MRQFYKTLDYKRHNSMKPPGLQNALGVILLCYILNFSIRNELICQGNEESPELLMSPVIGLPFIGLPSVEYQGTLQILKAGPSMYGLEAHLAWVRGSEAFSGGCFAVYGVHRHQGGSE